MDRYEASSLGFLLLTSNLTGEYGLSLGGQDQGWCNGFKKMLGGDAEE
jgi:hypothetical protein